MRNLFLNIVFATFVLAADPPAQAGFAPVITEFMAANEDSIRDEDGDRPDWIEICNTGDTAGNLNGWYLTDSAADLAEWAFPDTPLAAGAYLVVFASGKNRRVSGGELHTSFKLGVTGEYLALVRSDGSTVVSEYAPAYPAQLAGASYGLGMVVTEKVFVASSAACEVLVATDDALGRSWTGHDLVSGGGWLNGTAGVGYDLGGTPSAGLVAHWPLDETFGEATIADVTGNGYGGVANGGTTLGSNGATSRTATGATFNSGGIDVPYNDALNPASFTVVVWSRPATAGSGHRSVITSRRSSGGHYDGYIIYVNPANSWEFWTGDGNGWRSLGGPAVALDTWTHLAISYDSATQTKRFYINGSLHDSTTSQGYSPNPSSGLHIGSGGDAGTQYRFRGDIDDVALFNTVLEEADVRSAMTNSIPESGTVDYSGLIGLDVGGAMHDRNASAYVRFPFVPEQGASLSGLRLRLKYDDGFLAYLNGQLVASHNAPGTPRFDATATAMNPDAGAVLFEEFNLSSDLGLLRDGTNVLAVQGLNIASDNADFLIVPELVGTTAATIVPGEVGYFAVPTPGAENASSSSEIGPWISDVGHVPAVPSATESVVVTALVAETFQPVGSVTLHYRAMYEAESSVPMAHAGDGVYTATIPAGTANPGEMLRYRIVADDTSSNHMTAPIFVDRTGVKQSSEYFGTMVRDPSVSSALPIFHWWTQSYSASHSRAGARACVFFNGEFYENIFVRERGQATNSGSQKFIFGNARPLFVNERLGRVRECNMNAQGVDSSYIRQTLAFRLFAETGMPASESFLVWMRVNGGSDRVGVFIEQVDDEFLDRHGLDEQGSLYKFVQKRNLNPGLSEQPDGTEKKIPEDDADFSDLQTLIDGLALADKDAQHDFVFDHFNLPETISYLAVRAIIQDCDDVRKNFYMHRDSNDTGEWRIFPWDKDFTYGILGDGGTYATHPFMGDYVHRKQNANQWSRLFEAFYNLPSTRDMFRRRTRTLMDTYLRPPGTPAGEAWLEREASALFTPADPHLGSGASSSYSGVQGYFPTKRANLYVAHHEDQLPADVAGIPGAQAMDVVVRFGDYEKSPASGNQDEEYVQLVNTNASPPGYESNDWLELFNATSVTVSLGDWYLSDDVADLKKWAIPATNSMVPGGWAAFDEISGFHNPTNTGFGLNKAGEQVFLSYLPGTAQDRVADALRFEGQANGVTLGRFEDGEAHWLATVPTRGAANALAGPRVVIGELMYHPAPTDVNPENNTNDEYVELHNPRDSTELLWTAAGVWRVSGDIAYAFPSNSALSAKARVRLVPFDPQTNHAARGAFLAAHGLTNGQVALLGPYSGQLDNEGGRVSLEYPQAPDIAGEGVSWVVVDEVTYFDAPPWPSGADGTGIPLKRYALSGSGNDPAGWGLPRYDRDGDGLPDAWETEYLGGTNAAPGGHGDADGMTNGEEYGAGTDPADPFSAFRVEMASSNGSLAVSFTAREAKGAGYDGLKRYFDLEYAPDLPSAGWRQVVSLTNILGRDQVVRFAGPTNRAASFRARAWLEQKE